MGLVQLYAPLGGSFFTLIVTEGPLTGTYQSSFVSMDSHHIFISAPKTSSGHKIAGFQELTHVIADYRDSKDIPCRFTTEICILSDTPEDFLVLKCPQAIERHQRRENVRIPLALPVKITSPQLQLDAILCDVSGGGVSIWLNDPAPLQSGDIVRLNFSLPNVNEIEAEAKILHIQNENSSKSEFLCSCQFMNIDDALRKTIMDLVFERQIRDISLRDINAHFVF